MAESSLKKWTSEGYIIYDVVTRKTDKELGKDQSAPSKILEKGINHEIYISQKFNLTNCFKNIHTKAMSNFK